VVRLRFVEEAGLDLACEPAGRAAAPEVVPRRQSGERAGVVDEAGQVVDPGRLDDAVEETVDWLFGPALLVRREAADAVGLFDEDFFMFSEEVDWMTRFRRAGWTVVFFPGAEVVHVGGASHGGRMYVENLRGHLRWFAKHRGAKDAERVRKLLLWSLRLRAFVLRREVYREGVRFLSSGNARSLIE
jgi:GT2 family glycosyltransferase